MEWVLKPAAHIAFRIWAAGSPSMPHDAPQIWRAAAATCASEVQHKHMGLILVGCAASCHHCTSKAHSNKGGTSGMESQQLVGNGSFGWAQVLRCWSRVALALLLVSMPASTRASLPQSRAYVWQACSFSGERKSSR